MNTFRFVAGFVGIVIGSLVTFVGLMWLAVNLTDWWNRRRDDCGE